MCDKKLVALTFDDGPTIGITDQVLDIFDNYLYTTKKGVLDSITLTRKTAERLLRTLRVYINTETI